MQPLPAQPSRVQSGVGLPLAQQLEELCPTHRQLLLCTCLWLCGGWGGSPVPSPLSSRPSPSSPPHPYGLWGRPFLFKPWAGPSWLVVDPAFLAATVLPEPPRALTTKYLGPAFSLFSQLGLTCPFPAPLLLCPLISSSSVCR